MKNLLNLIKKLLSLMKLFNLITFLLNWIGFSLNLITCYFIKKYKWIIFTITKEIHKSLWNKV